MKISTLTLGGTLAGVLALTTVPVESALYVYEGFQYGPAGQDLVGNPDDLGGDDAADATGLSGTWSAAVGTGAEVDIQSGSLSSGPNFSGLTTNGNHVGALTSANSTVMARTTSVALNGSSDLWFSAVMQPLSSNSASQGGIAITSESLSNARITSNGGTSATLDGIGIGSETSQNWRAYAWDGGVESIGDAELSTSSGDNHLMVGHVSFNTGTGGTDVFQLYEYQGTVGSGSLVAVGSAIEVDLAEGALDTLNITRQRLAVYDEIRIADNLNEALGLPIPEPSSLALIAMGGMLIARRRRG